LGAVENSERKSELKPKSEESKKKRISVPSSATMRQSQTFVLAIIIIAAYVVFFAWIISTSPTTKDSHNVDVKNYDGMTTLAGTFGVIAAAVVGYYFGTRNLEQATSMAVEAKKEAGESKVKENEAKKEADENKNKLKNELEERVPSLEKGREVYDETKKLVDSMDKIDPTNKKLVLDSLSAKNVDIDEFKSKLHSRIRDVDEKLKTKKRERDMIGNY
jgi:hypothetical protein